MTDFYRETSVKKVRKAHPCNGCGHRLSVGGAAIRIAGKFEGDFNSFVYHPDCRDAEVWLNDEIHRSEIGEWVLLHEADREDGPWLFDKFPAVAKRLGLAANAAVDVGRLVPDHGSGPIHSGFAAIAKQEQSS